MNKQPNYDLRTDVEKEVHEAIQMALFYFGKRVVGIPDFMSMMGKLRDANVKLENKRMGCMTGLHVEACMCSSGINRSINCIKHHKHKRNKNGTSSDGKGVYQFDHPDGAPFYRR